MEPLSVLLIDDNPTFIKIVRQFLDSRGGLEVVGVAVEGAEALQTVRSLQPDLVLLDLGMPGINGMEILPVLRTVLPEGAIIVLTLLEGEVYQGAALRAGADAFVSKAALNQELMPAIERAIEGRCADSVVPIQEDG